MISLKKTLRAIATRLSNEADYVVEQGTSGIWTYRKWNSGIAECWGTKTFSKYAITGAWGGIYDSASYMQENYPSGLFESLPSISVAAYSEGAILSVETWGGGATTTPQIAATRPSSATLTSVTFCVTAKGRWK